jgi:sugar phosphate isomerase/epimerase
MPTIAYQLYCSRNFPPLDDTLAMLAQAGYAAVEGYGGLYADVDALKASLDRNGLTMPSGHFGLDMVEGDPARAIETARTLGVSKVFVPYVAAENRPGDRAGWEAFASRLQEAGKPIRDAGLAYGWHNHDFELQDLGGVTPLDLIAQTGMDLELDLAWVRRGGQDPLEWLRKLGRQVKAVHVKDIAPQGEAIDEDGWADVGHGTMDWPAIRAELSVQGIDHWVVEHDNPKDHARFARRSLQTLQAW